MDQNINRTTMATISIGRANDNDITVPSDFTQVSNHHATITRGDGGAYVLHDTSSNGTSVNGQTINNQSAATSPGDEIILAGQYHLLWLDIENALDGQSQRNDRTGKGTILGDLSNTIRSYATAKPQPSQANSPYENLLWDDRYRLIKRLGNGATAQVWLALDTKADDIEVAVKIFSAFGAIGTRGQQLFVKEFTGVHNLKHTNLLTPSSYDICNNVPYLVSNYCKKGSAISLIGNMTEEEVAKFLKGTAEGLSFLHQHKIIHQDIKPDNILIDAENNYVLTDFGITGQENKEIQGGTPAYMAPEFFNGQRRIATPETDIWALGASVFELIAGDVPFGDDGGKALLNGAKTPALPKSFKNKTIRDIVRRCLDINPKKRPTAAEILLALYSGPKRGWIIAAILTVAIAAVSIYAGLTMRTKIVFFQNYTEKNGIPAGIRELSEDDTAKTPHYKAYIRMGHIDSIVRISPAGKIIPDSCGYTGKKYIYKGDEPDEVLYYGVCRKPLFKIDYETKFSAFIKNFDGTPKILSGKVACYIFEYDKDGNLTKTTFCDLYKQPAADENGHYGIQRKYSNGVLTVEYFIDAKGAKLNDSNNITKRTYDPNGLLVSATFKDGRHEEYKNTEDGLVMQKNIFDSNGKPMQDTDGVHCYKYKYDTRYNCTEETYYGTDGAPCSIAGAYAYFRKNTTYDKNDKPTETSYYDTDDSLCLRYTYDTNGKIISKYDVEEEKRKAEEAKRKAKQDSIINAQKHQAEIQAKAEAEAAAAAQRWVESMKNLSTPHNINTDYVLISIKTSGTNVAMIVKIIKYSKFQLDDNNIAQVGETATKIKKDYSEQKPSGASLKVTIVDKSGREILTK